MTIFYFFYYFLLLFAQFQHDALKDFTEMIVKEHKQMKNVWYNTRRIKRVGYNIPSKLIIFNGLLKMNEIECYIDEIRLSND